MSSVGGSVSLVSPRRARAPVHAPRLLLDRRYPLIAAAAAALPTNATIDGKAEVCDSDGIADFARLHSRGHDAVAFLWAFDLLELGGEDLRSRPLLEWKNALHRLQLRTAKHWFKVKNPNASGALRFKEPSDA